MTTLWLVGCDRIQSDWTKSMARKLQLQKQREEERERERAGRVMTRVWRKHRKQKMSAVRRAVISLQTRWRSRMAMKHVSAHRAMYELVLGPAVKKLQVRLCPVTCNALHCMYCNIG